MSDSSAHANNPLSSTAWTALRADLRSFAEQHLPRATVPSQFVVVPELPKLANGKIDRKRLAAVRQEAAPDDAHVPPETPQEIRVAAIWADLLKVGRVGLHDDFFELGGNSLMAAQMAARVRAETGTAINLRRLFESPTVARLVELLDGQSQPHKSGVTRERALGISAEELLDEARLPEDITPDPRATPCSRTPYRTIFLTGGNGYTGAYLIRELLERSSARLFVLVRANDEAHARRRIRAAMERFGVWRDDAVDRVTPVTGDLARPYFGVDRPTYERLARDAEAIVHNGALSSYAMSYRTLKPVNVLGTQEVLRLACRDRIKAVHYVSSLGVSPTGSASHWPELEVTERERVTGGYVQTKWVGDSMILQAGRRGVPVCVYRPGLITGAQDTGACETDTFINAMTKGCVQLGAAPTSFADVPLQILPVDFCAAAIAHIVFGREGPGKVFNMPGARSMMFWELLDHLAAYGYRLRPLPFPEWYRELTAAVERGEENELARFISILESSYHDMADEKEWPTYETANLRAALSGSGIACSPPDRALWGRYLRWFIETGFLPSP